MRSSPLIAVNGLWADGEKPGLRLHQQYLDPLLRAGATPVGVAPKVGSDYLERLLDSVDGVLLTGGDDFETEALGLGPIHPEANPTPTHKQRLDFDLLRLALERELPVLGICYGMQLMGLLGGSRLLQHLPSDRPGCQEHEGGVEHSVRIEPGSKLAQSLKLETDETLVVSRHHQALADVQSPWIISAQDSEGLIEAIEHPSHRFAIGVQWHPELCTPPGPQAELFHAFVGAAQQRTFQPSSAT